MNEPTMETLARRWPGWSGRVERENHRIEAVPVLWPKEQKKCCGNVDVE